MLCFKDYEIQKKRFLDAQQKLDEVLSEKEEIFAKTQPKSIPFDKEKVDGGSAPNAFDEYLVEMERKRINERIAEAKFILEDRRELFKTAEEMLTDSKDIDDIIYRLKYIERKNNRQIAKMVHYSESQVYRILSNIAKMIENERL